MKLIDRFGRSIDYVRISITDRCDLRCAYCIPKGYKGFEKSANWLGFDEYLRIARAFVQLGVRKFRITGGEPLLRRGVVDFIRQLSSLPGVTDVSMTTNGTRLAILAQPLASAGLNRLNVSLDSLRRDCVQEITGSDSLPLVINGLIHAQQAGFKQIKINMVPLLGMNESDIRPMLDFCQAHGFILSLIEVMPIGDSARSQTGMNLTKLVGSLVEDYGLQATTHIYGNGPARYWQDASGRFKLGLITPLSQHFCASCNRVRLSAEGTIYTCLGEEFNYPLKSLLRDGCSERELRSAILAAIAQKPRQHDFIRAPEKIIRIMAKTGG
ncbi:GTP 3',8-cyclase MoaA [Snodgrassella sp. CFCC 13594]|uniref:GTP 3',8-cyclase MoaA n=1 Tax=Snodgrassella sp. CFCC 13594 TaxID=1775559 RepID=UPI000836C809|nr:GTP 3',8-cyclase MoaA [Snodgrassella sp. CFCC 13594]